MRYGSKYGVTIAAQALSGTRETGMCRLHLTCMSAGIAATIQSTQGQRETLTDTTKTQGRAMGYRQYDADCMECFNTRPVLLWVDHGEDAPRNFIDECRHCRRDTEHVRIISLIAPYTGEKVLNVEVHGGEFDTAGSRAFKTMKEIPEPKNMEDRADRRAHIEAYKERFASSEWKEMKRENASIARENAAKQKRLAAIKSGENYNMRRDRLPGDPKITA